MSSTSLTQNINADELGYVPLPLLVITYKAHCSYCRGMATSYYPMIRVLPCHFVKQ